MTPAEAAVPARHAKASAAPKKTFRICVRPHRVMSPSSGAFPRRGRSRIASRRRGKSKSLRQTDCLGCVAFRSRRPSQSAWRAAGNPADKHDIGRLDEARLIEFGRRAVAARKRRGRAKRKPPIFARFALPRQKVARAYRIRPARSLPGARQWGSPSEPNAPFCGARLLANQKSQSAIAIAATKRKRPIASQSSKPKCSSISGSKDCG